MILCLPGSGHILLNAKYILSAKYLSRGRVALIHGGMYIGSMGRKQKNPAAVTLGSLGGKARAKKLSAERRREIARKAIQARWAQRKSVRKDQSSANFVQ